MPQFPLMHLPYSGVQNEISETALFQGCSGCSYGIVNLFLLSVTGQQGEHFILLREGGDCGAVKGCTHHQHAEGAAVKPTRSGEPNVFLSAKGRI